MPHGIARYNKQRCRCQVCRAAKARKWRRYVDRKFRCTRCGERVIRRGVCGFCIEEGRV